MCKILVIERAKSFCENLKKFKKNTSYEQIVRNKKIYAPCPSSRVFSVTPLTIPPHTAHRTPHVSVPRFKQRASRKEDVRRGT